MVAESKPTYAKQWYAQHRESVLARQAARRAAERRELIASVLPVSDFAYKQAAEGTNNQIFFGVRSHLSVQWFSVTRDQAAALGRAMLTAAGKKPACEDALLDLFRAARIQVQLGGMEPNAAAKKYGIDPELLTEWIRRLDDSAQPKPADAGC